jgi:hypothetical protein
MYGLKMASQLMRREQYMLSQFRNNLQVTIERLCAASPDQASALQLFNDHLNEGELSWSTVNHVEQALVAYYDEVSLETEWQRQLSAIDRLPTQVAQFYMDHAETANPDKQRTLLLTLIKDIQWARESKRVIRFNENTMRRKTVTLFLCSFVLFFSPTITRVFLNFEFDNLRLYYIFTAASAGILGAAFSQLTSIQSRVQGASRDQVNAMSQLGYILARAMVGAGAGLIMFYLLQSGLLSGAFFPEFIHSAAELEVAKSELTIIGSSILANSHGVSQGVESSLSIGTLVRPAEGLSLLVVWCLIAGFSEKMIPGILNKKSDDAVSSS